MYSRSALYLAGANRPSTARITIINDVDLDHRRKRRAIRDAPKFRAIHETSSRFFDTRDKGSSDSVSPCAPSPCQENVPASCLSDSSSACVDQESANSDLLELAHLQAVDDQAIKGEQNAPFHGGWYLEELEDYLEFVRGSRYDAEVTGEAWKWSPSHQPDRQYRAININSNTWVFPPREKTRAQIEATHVASRTPKESSRLYFLDFLDWLGSHWRVGSPECHVFWDNWPCDTQSTIIEAVLEWIKTGVCNDRFASLYVAEMTEKGATTRRNNRTTRAREAAAKTREEARVISAASAPDPPA